jgi:hypothetical protein
MAFTTKQRITGIKAAIKSPNTPEQLRKGLREYLKRLKSGN